MSSGGESKRTVDVNRFGQEKINDEVLEEIESNDRRKGLWVTALQKSRGDEHKAMTLYIKYREQFIKGETKTAKELSRVPSTTIIQNYITKIERHDPKRKEFSQNAPSNLMSQNSRKKKCYKCGKKISLEVKPCPKCNCNSFVFCN